MYIVYLKYPNYIIVIILSISLHPHTPPYSPLLSFPDYPYTPFTTILAPYTLLHPLHPPFQLFPWLYVPWPMNPWNLHWLPQLPVYWCVCPTDRTVACRRGPVGAWPEQAVTPPTPSPLFVLRCASPLPCCTKSRNNTTMQVCNVGHRCCYYYLIPYFI